MEMIGDTRYDSSFLFLLPSLNKLPRSDNVHVVHHVQVEIEQRTKESGAAEDGTGTRYYCTGRAGACGELA
jgi:hypothetical protein